MIRERNATDAVPNTVTSAPITIIANNHRPTTAMLMPSNGATVSGASELLDASASRSAGIASVTSEVRGGTLSDRVVAMATPTIYGWLGQWNTTTISNGTYSLQSVATDRVLETAALISALLPVGHANRSAVRKSSESDSVGPAPQR